MPIDLPPPATPDLAPAAEVQAIQSRRYSGKFNNNSIEIFGPEGVSDEMFAAAQERADSLSTVVRMVAQLYYGSGVITARTYYARVGDVVYVGVVDAGFSGASVADPLAQYFEGVSENGRLKVSTFERGRALASVHAERANLDTQAGFVASGEQVGFNLGAEPTGEKPTKFQMEIGNPGNRFVGRHFAHFEARTGTDRGDELRVFWRAGLMGLNNDARADDYVEHLLSWSRVSNWGVISAAARYINYDLLTTPNLTGELWYGELSWLDILHADFDSRWTVHARADRQTKVTEVRDGGERLQWEPYWSGELGSNYSKVLGRALNGAVSTEGTLVARKGFGGAGGRPITSADLSYLLIRPSLKLGWASAQGHWAVTLAARYQATDDRVPEQQQWVLGGTESVRAWLPGVAVGDKGGYASLTVAYQGLSLFDRRIKLEAFAEGAETQFNASNDGSPGSAKAQLVDAGAELSVKPVPSVTLSLIAASPLSDDNVDQAVLADAEADWFFRLTWDF